MEELFIKFWREIVAIEYDEDAVSYNYTRIFHKYTNAEATLFCKKLDKLTIKNLCSFPENFELHWEDDYLPLLDSTKLIEIVDGGNFELSNDFKVIVLPMDLKPLKEAFVVVIKKEALTDSFLSFLENANIALTQRYKVKGLTEVLAQKNHQFNIIMETIPEAVIYLEESGNMVWLNSLAKTMLKINSEDPKPEEVSAAMQNLRISANNKEEILEVGSKLFQNKNSEIKDWHWLYGDPISLVYEVTVLNTNYKDSQGQLWIFANTTSQYLASQKLLLLNNEIKEKIVLAENANNAKSAFLANMSHELRTPLNSVLGFSQILLQSTELNKNDREHVNFIYKSGEHLLSLINDILDLSKIEAGKFELYRNKFSLPTLLHTISKMLEVKSIEKGLDFEIELSPDLPKTISFDEQKLKQVLLNLLSNAVKYTDKGEVHLSAKLINKIENKAIVLFIIRDTGRGIEKDNIDKIFVPFKQLNAGNSYVQGTGLGLSITKSLIEMMGSKISVESEIGKGSKFSFELELDELMENEEEVNITEEISGYKGERKKILLVDDNLLNRILFEKMLRRLEFKIEQSESGNEALERINTFLPDLIFMDLRMPGISGYEAIKIIKANPKYKSVKIIATSASAFNETRNKCIEAGADDFIFKPIQFSELITKLTTNLKLDWIYRKKSKPIAEKNSKLTVIVDPQILTDLLTASKQGEIAKIESLIKTLKEKYPENETLWARYEKFTNHFEINLLIDSLNNLLEEKK